MGFLFNPVTKVQKDRHVLKKIDRELATKSIPSMLSYFLVFLILDFVMGFREDTRMASYAIGLSILLIAVLRIFYALRFDTLYARGPARWRRHFMLLSLFNSAIWGGIQVFVLYNARFFQAETLMLLYSSAITAGTITLFSAYINYVRSFIVLILLPPALVLFLRYSVQDAVLGVGMLAYAVFLLYEARKLHQNFWDKIEYAHQLQQQLAVLNASRLEEEQRADVTENVLHTIMGLIKTPLQGVLGMLTLLKDSRLDNDQQKALELAAQSGDAMVSLITDLEDYSKIRNGSLQLENKFFDLRSFTEQMMQDMGSQAHSNELELSYLYDIDVPSRVNLDKKHIGQVIHSQIQFAFNNATTTEVVFKVSSQQEAGQPPYLRLCVYFGSEDLDTGYINDTLSGDSLDKETHLNSSTLSLLISARLVAIMEGQLSCRQLETEDYYVLEAAVPLEASSQQIDPFQSSKSLIGRELWLISMPDRAGKGLAGETRAWGMEVRDFQNLSSAAAAVNDEQVPDYVLLNLPISLTDPDWEAGVRQFTGSLPDSTLLILYGSQRQKERVDGKFGPLPFLAKPAGRYALHDALLQHSDDVEETMEAPPEPAATPEFTGRQILLAEENDVNRLVTEALLKKLGCAVVSVTDGEQLVNEMQKQEFDMVLTDQSMPLLSGLDATRLIREKENNQNHTPILAMILRNDDADKRACLAAGIDDFISKPVTIEDLNETLRRWIA